MRAQLACIMQSNSYGPNQPTRKELRIPRGRARGTQRNNTRAGWGGARNRKDRTSTALKQEHTEGILKAIAVADLKGMPLNRFWTVNYEWAGIDDRNGAAFIGKLMELCNRYTRAKSGEFAAVWVREIGVKNGAHVHIAMHLSAGWKLSGHQTRKWITGAGGKYGAKVSKIVAIGGRLDCVQTNPGHYWANAEAMANYMVKGSADDVADDLGLSLRKHSGQVIGKRWGRTQNLAMS